MKPQQQPQQPQQPNATRALVVPPSSDWCARRECRRSNMLPKLGPMRGQLGEATCRSSYSILPGT
jgi:hypothetical protein